MNVLNKVEMKNRYNCFFELFYQNTNSQQQPSEADHMSCTGFKILMVTQKPMDSANA